LKPYSLLEAALEIAGRGWPVFPCHTIRKDGRCSCGEECGKSAGKHPRTEHGLKDATTSEKIIRAWWRTWPDANLALATGGTAPEVLDADLKETVSGLETLADLQLKHGPMPDTLSQHTGGGGRQYFFKPSGKVRNKVAFAPGLDTRGTGGYVIIPPSLHKSGKRYQWANGITELAHWPAWLLEEILRGQSKADPGKSDRLDPLQVLAGVPEGQRDTRLFQYACRLRAKDMAREEAEVLVLQAAANCRPAFPEQDALAKVERAWNYKPGKAEAEAKKAEPPSGWTAAELVAADFPEPAWILPGLLPQGLTLLAGKPKVGKSWLALGVGIAVACGGVALGSIPAERGRVLHLPLEDTPRRLKKRLEQLLTGAAPEALHFFTRWPRLDSGGLLHLDAFLQDHADCRLLIIDTLAKVRKRPSGKASGNLYLEDHEALEGLKELADKYNLAALVVTHLRKAAAEDVVDLVSGTTGLTGAADTVLILQRGRGQADAILNATGRDVEEQELALRFDREGCYWSILGDARELAATRERQELVDALRAADSPLSPKELAEMTGKKPGAVRRLLFSMVEAGEIRKEKYGKYIIISNSGNSKKVVTVVTPVTVEKGSVTATEKCYRPPVTVRSAEIQGSAASVTSVTGVSSVLDLEHCDGCPYLHLPATWKPEDAMCQQASKFLREMESCPRE
jgi:Bifunctional DNA primase/polymerase, N-terminal/AAA domain/IclR helix-turn-helix domain